MCASLFLGFDDEKLDKRNVKMQKPELHHRHSELRLKPSFISAMHYVSRASQKLRSITLRRRFRRGQSFLKLTWVWAHAGAICRTPNKP
jgi:hypothetical protein